MEKISWNDHIKKWSIALSEGGKEYATEHKEEEG
jgi:hypothetical protein